MNRHGNKTRTKPIKNHEVITAMAAYLKTTDKERGQAAYIIWLLCVNGGLRVSDALRLRIAAVCGQGKRVKDCLYLTEEKTGKQRIVTIGQETRKEIQNYIDSLDWSKMKFQSYLFPSSRKPGHHMSYEWMNNRIKEAAAVCTNERCTTHSMRKTFAHLWFETNKKHYGNSTVQTAIALQENILHHNKLSDTLRYIDEEESYIRETCKGIDITI